MGAQEWAVDLNGFIVPIGDGEAIDVLETGITVVLSTDHLAALARVRVETLREARAAVLGAEVFELAPRQTKAGCVATIDRLINAATTPLARCESCGHPREHHMEPPLGCYCRCTASDNAATTGATDD